MNTGVAYSSTEEIEVHGFSLAATLGLPLLAIFLQAYIPIAFHGRLHFFDIFDLPLLITIFFAVSRRNPASGAITGCVIGLMQDALTAKFIGLFGIAKTVVGYAASSLGSKIDVDNPGSRLLITIAFYMLHRVMYLTVQRGMVQENFAGDWLHHLGAAVANGFLAVVLFAILDRFKRRS
jgi:rod shape-determining protein MreD